MEIKMDFFKSGESLKELHLSVCLSQEVRPSASIPTFSSPPRFCTLIQQNYKGLSKCLRSDKQGLRIASNKRVPYIYECHAGLIDGVIPIVFMDKCIAFVMLGQFLYEKPSREKFEKVWDKVKDLGLDYEELWNAYQEVPVVSRNFVEYISQGLFELTDYIVERVVHSFRTDKQIFERMRSIIDTKRRLEISKDLIDLELWSAALSSQSHQLLDEERELLARLRWGSQRSISSFVSQVLEQLLEKWEEHPRLVRSQVWGLILSLLRVVKFLPSPSVDLLKLTLQYANLLDKCRHKEDIISTVEWVVNDILTLREEPQMGKSIVERAKEYILRHYKEELRLEKVAKEVRLSPNYFSKLFKRVTGYSFAAYLTQLRIAKAKDLLENTTLSVTEVALEVGFNDPAYFTSVFKRYVGMKPLAYRKVKKHLMI